MKTCKLAPLIVTVGLLLSGCMPDLVVTTLQTTGPPTVNAETRVEVPIRVVVKNQGNAAANIFKVAIEYTAGPIRARQTRPVRFTVPGQSEWWCPLTTGSLAAGSSVTFPGKVTFQSDVHGETVSLKATADSRSGDEFVPAYGRVQESNEGNNESTPISVSLP